MNLSSEPPRRGLILFAHGSSRPAWRAPLDALCAQVQAQVPPNVVVSLAFLERCPPTLPQVVDDLVADGVSQLEMLPLFISGGGHVQRDVPALLEQIREAHPTVTLTVQPAIGAHPAIVTAIAGMVRSPN